MSNPPVTEVVKNIRALTTALEIIQPQSAVTVGLIPARQRKYRALSKAYNHIAILLTQSPQGEDGTGRHVVAVTGSSDTSGFTVNAFQEIEELPSVKNLTVTQNARRGLSDGVPLKIEEIKPSGKTMQDLADPCKTLSTQQVSLDEHAKDVFQALIHLSEERSKHCPQFMAFIWLRCHRKIKDRLAADEIILGRPLWSLLDDWQLAPSDVVKDEWFPVNPQMNEQFQRFAIPFRDSTSKMGKPIRQYLFSRSTVKAWCYYFSFALRALKELAVSDDMQSMSISLYSAFHTLNHLLYDNHSFATLLALPSLEDHIRHAMNTVEERKRNEPSDKPAAVPALDDMFDLEHPNQNVVLRYCRAVLAWLRAGLSLSHPKVFHDPLPKFRFVCTYLPMHTTTMTNLPDLMRDIILPRLKPTFGIKNSDAIQQLLHRKDFGKKTKFSGKIHCEANLMALVHSFSSTGPSQRVPPFSKNATLQLGHLFANADRVIGVGKESCLCCHWLALLLLEDSTSIFLLPGTRGVVFPWTPPSFGIPESILKRLEQLLIRQLVKVTEHWIASEAIIRSSRRSTPASQSSDEANDDIPFSPPFMK